MRAGVEKKGAFHMLKHSFKKKPYLPYIAPAMTIMTVLTVFPTIFLYVISVTNYQLGWDLSRVKFVWFNNYLRLFSGGDPDFWNAVYISLLFMVITTVIEMVFGFFIGKLLCDTEFKLKPVVFAILIVPIVMTPSIAGNIWKLMLNSEYGIINYFSEPVRHPQCSLAGCRQGLYFRGFGRCVAVDTLRSPDQLCRTVLFAF